MFTSNGFTTVWDFATSQVNGTIASLARTSGFFPQFPAYYNGNSVYANYMAGRSSSDTVTTGFYLGYDETNHYLYISTNNASIGGVSYPNTNIYRVKEDFSKIGLRNAMPPATQMTLIKTLTSSDGNAIAYNWVYDRFENNFVYINANTIHLVAIDGTHTTKTISVTATRFVVAEDYYWVFDASNYKMYCISKTNVANVQELSLGANYEFAPSESDAVFAYALNQPTLVLYPDGTIFTSEVMTESATKFRARQVGPFYAPLGNSPASQMFPSTHYLGTIANLDSPVTKTSSQTMKITYTLTEA